MQIHRIMVAVNHLASLESGVELKFAESVGLLDEGDAIVARLADGTERLMIVRTAHPDSWQVAFESPGPPARLERIGPRALRLTLG